MILSLKLQYYLHWREIWKGKRSVPCLWILCYAKVWSQCAFSSSPVFKQHIQSLHYLGRGQLPSFLLSLEQSCICSCLNTGRKTSACSYALFHIFHSYNFNRRKLLWACAHSEVQDGLHHTPPFHILELWQTRTRTWQNKTLKNLITLALVKRCD